MNEFADGWGKDLLVREVSYRTRRSYGCATRVQRVDSEFVGMNLARWGKRIRPAIKGTTGDVFLSLIGKIASTVIVRRIMIGHVER